MASALWQKRCASLGEALSLSGPRRSGRCLARVSEGLWEGLRVPCPGTVHPYLHPAPRLITRETNLKFRQAPPVTHHELTSIRKMASFQGERQQARNSRHPRPVWACPSGQRVQNFPTSLGFGAWQWGV